MSNYYKPYFSDESSGSDSESVDSDGSAMYRSEDALLDIPGRSPPHLGTPDAANVHASPPPRTGTKLETQESKNTTLFMVNSRDRDTSVFVQPTFFTLRMPRVFKNIKTVNISQLNLLNSFFNFSQAKNNTWAYVLEQDRTATDQTTGKLVPNKIKIQIREGTYTADDLVTELSNALNSTPLFADLDRSTFINTFQNTGNFGIMFNTPGPVVFNNLTQTYDTKQTLATIVARYFQTVQTVGTTSYTYNECLMAFYYPVMKEMLTDPNVAQPPFSFLQKVPPNGFASWYDYIVFGFQGLNDPYIMPLVLYAPNQKLFDTYRYEHTFNMFLVNKYTCAYNTKQGRLVITAPSLCDSIQSNLTAQYNQYLYTLVTSSNFKSIADFQTQYSNIVNSNGALIELYNFIQVRFTSNFAVDFGQYSDTFYSDSNNEINIYNTNNRYGWQTSFTAGVSASTITTTAPPVQSPNYWSNILVPITVPEHEFIPTIPLPSLSNGELYFSNAGETQFGYFDVMFHMSSTKYVRTEFKTPRRQNISIMTLPRYLADRGDGTEEVYTLGSSITATPLLYNIDPVTSAETLRIDVVNTLFNMYTIQQTMFYSSDYMRALDKWLDYTSVQIVTGSRVQPTSSDYGKSPPIGDIALTSYRPFLFFQVNADKYWAEPQAHFRITLTVESQSETNFPTSLVITWYKDRAGFMADALNEVLGKTGQQNARHYFKRQYYSTSVSSATLVVDVNNMQETYFSVTVAPGGTVPNNIPVRVFAVLTDTYGDYTLITQNDRLDMPYANLPLVADQYSPASEVFKDPTASIYDSNIFQLGYDISGVSNNLLDYIIQAGNNNYYDPINISDYIDAASTGLRFQMNISTPGASSPPPNISSPTKWSLFFGSNSRNQIRDTYDSLHNIYLNSNIPLLPLNTRFKNEFTLVNWFGANNSNQPEMFLTPSIDGTYNTAISTTSIFLPRINSGGGGLYDASTSSAFQDISGICGIGFFLPPNQIVKMDSFLVKFAYTQPSADSNLADFTRSNSPLPLAGTQYTSALYRNQTTNIATTSSPAADWDDWFLYNRRNLKLGVFKATDIYGISTQNVVLSNAVCTMTLKKVTQVNSFANQPGSFRTREPDWGTWYAYEFDPVANKLWDVKNVSWTPSSTDTWRSTITTADFGPTYTAANTSYSNYFLTTAQINNYTFLPRSYGIAPSVGNAVFHPTLLSTFTSDIPSSYVAVPFYKHPITGIWTVGAFWGLSYTRTPAVPAAGVTGASPYYGPPGIFGYSPNAAQVIDLYKADAPTYQPYYWNTKITYETLDLQYDPATDLQIFGGYNGIKEEYQDTMLYVYKNTTPKQDLNDVSGVTGLFNTPVWKWGLESSSNYNQFDDQSGYNFLSYVHDMNVRPNNSGTQHYAVHVRAYDPIPQFNTGLRIIGKNVTDFGKPSLWEIGLEISTIKGYTPITDISGVYFNNELVNKNDASAYNSTISTNNAYRVNGKNAFSHEYADTLVNFDRSFSTSGVLGQNIGYVGRPYSYSGYKDALVDYITFFSSIRGFLETYTSILSTATGQLNEYVIQTYGRILPSTIIQRNRITDALPFQFLFSTMLVAPYTTMFDEWGLGYNLGFNKADTPNPPRTTVTSDTFIRIVQDYVYLRLNPEFNMNDMAVSGKENLADTHDTAAQDGKYFSKIILNSFGGFCRTAVQMPKQFNPVLGKYDTISCQLVDKNGQQISNADCEYDFVLEVTELTNGPSDNSSLIGPKSDVNVYTR